MRALRCQLPRANRFYPPEPPKKTDVRPPQLPGGAPVPADLLALIRFIADYYLAPIGEALRLLLPSSEQAEVAERVVLTAEGQTLAGQLDAALLPAAAAERSDKELAVLRALLGLHTTRKGAAVAMEQVVKVLAAAARIGASYGYVEINLNVGCPSERVQSGAFGACLMREPDLVADCLSAMREAVTVPITVKHRLGVDDDDPRERLFSFVETQARAGTSTFIVHARKAWLSNFSPNSRDSSASMFLR